MKHTPAPWTLQEHEHEPCQLIGNGTIHIADIYMTDFPVAKADSLLIAAAPELLSELQFALRDVLARIHMLPVHDVEQRPILEAQATRYRAAIAKAVQS